MQDQIGDFLVRFTRQNHGKLQCRVAQKSVRVTMTLGGRKRLCAFIYEENPIRTVVTIGKMPADYDAFTALLQGMDEAAHQFISDGEMLYWKFDILLPNVSMNEVFGLWMQYAIRRAGDADTLIAQIEGDTVADGKYISPIESRSVN